MTRLINALGAGTCVVAGALTAQHGPIAFLGIVLALVGGIMAASR